MDMLLNIWPTMAALAAAIDRPYPTVSSWKKRGIPPKEFPTLIAAAVRDGHTLTYEQLIAASGPASVAPALSSEVTAP